MFEIVSLRLRFQYVYVFNTFTFSIRLFSLSLNFAQFIQKFFPKARTEGLGLNLSLDSGL